MNEERLPATRLRCFICMASSEVVLRPDHWQALATAGWGGGIFTDRRGEVKQLDLGNQYQRGSVGYNHYAKILQTYKA